MMKYYSSSSSWFLLLLPVAIIFIPQQLFGRLNLQHCLPKAQKTLLFRFSLRPGINYRLWVLENGKHPQEINLLQLAQSPNSTAMDGWGRMFEPASTRLKNRVKSPASAAAILPVPLCASSHWGLWYEKSISQMGALGTVINSSPSSVRLLNPLSAMCVWSSLCVMHLFEFCLRWTQELLRMRLTLQTKLFID